MVAPSGGRPWVDCMPEEEEKMTSAEMLKTRIPPGYLFHNRGRLGRAADWVLVPDERHSSPETERVSGAYLTGADMRGAEW